MDDETKEIQPQPETSSEIKSLRYHKRVELYAKLSGLEGIDPDSEVGKRIQERCESFGALASSALPPQYALKLVYMAVETEMAKNAAFSWMLTLRPPRKPTDEGALPHRQSYATATTAYMGFARLLMQIMELLQSGKEAPLEVSRLQKKFKELPKITDITT